MLLPLFPLKLVIFPGQALSLHIFEPRYKQLIGECEANGTSFGIPAYVNGKLSEVGTELKLSRIVKRHPKGELDVEVVGQQIFRIEQFYTQAPNRLYPAGEITPLPFSENMDEGLLQLLMEKIKDLYTQLQVLGKLPEGREAYSSFNIGHQVGLTLEQEYQLLCIPAEPDRQQFILDHLDELVPEVTKREALKRKIQMNGHFKNVIPPK